MIPLRRVTWSGRPQRQYSICNLPDATPDRQTHMKSIAAEAAATALRAPMSGIETRRRPRRHRPLSVADAIATARLRPVERDVGAFDQVVRGMHAGPE